jgi:predicted DNA-binding protein (MmcQ/YjbR family)
MDNERIDAICMALPHVNKTLNWGHRLVYWVGKREIGGKMFAMTDLDGSGHGLLLFHCGAERFRELLEIEGMAPAPHLARAYWVAMERWNVLRPRQIEDELRRAHELIFASLPARTRALLALPAKKRTQAIRERKTPASAQERLPANGHRR